MASQRDLNEGEVVAVAAVHDEYSMWFSYGAFGCVFFTSGLDACTELSLSLQDPTTLLA